MKCLFVLLSIFSVQFACWAQPVFRNPGLSDTESFEINELVDPIIGHVTTKVNITLNEKNHLKYYTIQANEGNYFLNEIEVRYSDLTTISEKRTDLKTHKVIQYFKKSGDTVQFYNSGKNISKIIITDETNIYSPLAYYFSFRGFPFETSKSVSFKTYMYEYGGVLTMNLVNSGKETVSVKAGTFECYVMELSVGGWQSMFAPDKYYLYFTVANPHTFVKYKEKIDDKWSTDELIWYNK